LSGVRPNVSNPLERTGSLAAWISGGQIGVGQTRQHGRNARRAFSGSGPVEGAPRSRRGRHSARTSPAPAPTRGLCSPRRGQDPKSHLGGSTRWASSETITSVIPSSNARQMEASLWLNFRVACVLSALACAVEKPGRPRLRLNPSTASSKTVLCDVVSESVSTMVRSVRWFARAHWCLARRDRAWKVL